MSLTSVAPASVPSDFQSHEPWAPSVGGEEKLAPDFGQAPWIRAAASGVDVLDQPGAGRGAVGLPELASMGAVGGTEVEPARHVRRGELAKVPLRPRTDVLDQCRRRSARGGRCDQKGRHENGNQPSPDRSHERSAHGRALQEFATALAIGGREVEPARYVGDRHRIRRRWAGIDVPDELCPRGGSVGGPELHALSLAPGAVEEPAGHAPELLRVRISGAGRDVLPPGSPLPFHRTSKAPCRGSDPLRRIEGSHSRSSARRDSRRPDPGRCP